MLICDTHADTLWNMVAPGRDAGLPCDVTREYLTAWEGVRVQALALYIPAHGMEASSTFLQRELDAFE